jgi:hypothetical protein
MQGGIDTVIFSWWLIRSCPKNVENNNKPTKKKLCTRLILFARFIPFFSDIFRVN